ncbi:MAG: hypothetical protein J1E61_03755 [Lachnospiraceae bacterium]|nr:hypothetical protein [Lachnospiraceae bacterium]
MYRQQKDYVTENHDDNRVIILGDSRTKAGMIPEVLSGDCYNLALGGTTPIEGYYTLKEYLENHPAPQCVFISYAPMHYMGIDALWTRNIYFHVMNDEDAVELFQIAASSQEKEQILPEHYFINYAMYRFYLPNKYGTAVKNAISSDRLDVNREKYDQVTLARGQNYFGLANGSSDVNGEAKEVDFIPSETVTLYLQRIFDLCNEEGIRVIVEQMPMNETSRLILTEDFKTHFRVYINKLAEDNPTVEISGELYMYPNAYFGDADHLNPEGASAFCQFMKERYYDVFY